MDERESLNRPLFSARASSERDRIGEGERPEPAGTLSGLFEGAGAEEADLEPEMRDLLFEPSGVTIAEGSCNFSSAPALSGS